MESAGFLAWLHGCADALLARRAAWLQRHRMRRAEAKLTPEARAKASFWRARYLARNARLQRERDARATRRHGLPQSPASDPTSNPVAPAPPISKADVLAAIARSRASREARLKAAREDRKRP